MNAGGVPNTCKSNGVAYTSGERVSNTLVTCPKDGNITWKRVAKPNKLILVREG
jgi:hypothetical protein